MTSALLHGERSIDTKSDTGSVMSGSFQADGLKGGSSSSTNSMPDSSKLIVMKEKMEDMRREIRVQQQVGK